MAVLESLWLRSIQCGCYIEVIMVLGVYNLFGAENKQLPFLAERR